MSIFERMENKGQVASANQVPTVTILNAAAPVVSAAPKKTKADLEAEVAALRAQLASTSTNQVPTPVVQSAVPPVQMTHFHHYPAGVNKQGRAYPEGWVITAKEMPVGQKFIRGMSADDIAQIRQAYPKGQPGSEKAFFEQVIDPAYESDAVMKTSNLYKKKLAETNVVYVK